MKKVFLSLIVLTLLVGISAFAAPKGANAYYGSSYNVMGTTYYNLDNGLSGSSYNVMGTTYYNFNNGLSGSSYNVMGTTYYNWYTPSYSSYYSGY